MLIGWLGTAIVSLAVVVGSKVFGPVAAMAAIVRCKPGFMMIRIAVLVLLIGGWPRWIEVLGRKYRLTPEQCGALLNSRWRFAAWLLLLEVGFVQGGLMEWRVLFR
jgi:hypothetical protein